MGQLERYGLYVLCVVIFLILGVALWGDDPVVNHGVATPPNQVAALEAKGPDNADQATPKAPQVDPTREAADRAEKARTSAADALRQQFAGPVDADAGLDAPLQSGRTGDAKSRANPSEGDAKKGEPKVDSKTAEAGVRAVATDYVIQAGDNLESIAAAKLGSARAWKEIEKANPGLDARTLKIGAKIKLPAKPTPATAAAPPAKPALAADEYEVRAGDTLEKIAKLKLGKETRWRDIQAVNPGLNPSRLQLGARIKLPTKPAEVSANR